MRGNRNIDSSVRQYIIGWKNTEVIPIFQINHDDSIESKVTIFPFTCGNKWCMSNSENSFQLSTAMVKEQKTVNTDCINGNRISSININEGQSPVGKASIIFGVNYTTSGRYHSIMGKIKKMDSSVRSQFGRTNNKVIMKDQIYSEESTASGNRKSPIISCNR